MSASQRRNHTAYQKRGKIMVFNMTDKTFLHFHDLWKAYGYTGKEELAKVYSLDENAFLVLFNIEGSWKVGVIDGDCFTILYAGNETDATSFYENF